MTESDKTEWNYTRIAYVFLTNYEEVFRNQNKISKNYLIDTVNCESTKAICKYFANDSDFEKIKDGFSLKKGLLILGPAGTGKTHLLKNLQKNPRVHYKLVQCSEVANQFSCNGREVLKKYSNRYDEDEYRKTGRAFDDFGAEDIGINFSDKCETMLQVLLSLYFNLNGDFFMVHMTSNLTLSQIRERYGDRLSSRIKEMFNIIQLLGDDRRK